MNIQSNNYQLNNPQMAKQRRLSKSKAKIKISVHKNILRKASTHKAKFDKRSTPKRKQHEKESAVESIQIVCPFQVISVGNNISLQSGGLSNFKQCNTKIPDDEVNAFYSKYKKEFIEDPKY